MKLDNDFKEAIRQLPEQEKDKLLLRLLRHDRILTHRLHFELMGLESLEERREAMEIHVTNRVRAMSTSHHRVIHLTPKIRSLSGEITEHVKITSDQFGEVSLNLLMLNEVIRLNDTRLAALTPEAAHKISMYIIARAFKLLVLIAALHDDYLVEFRDDLQQLGEYIQANNHLKRTALQNGLDVNWLLTQEIPEDIKRIHTAVRGQGMLK